MAAGRGIKGFSPLVQEAIDLYVSKEAERKRRAAIALAALDEIPVSTEEQAAAMHRVVEWSRSERARRFGWPNEEP